MVRPLLIAILLGLVASAPIALAQGNAKAQARAKKRATAKQAQAAVEKTEQDELSRLKDALDQSRQETARLQASVEELRKELQQLRKQVAKKPAAELAPEREISIIYLKYALASEMSQRLMVLFDGAKIIPDARLNALVVHCTKDQLEAITELAQRLDEAPDAKK